MATNPPKDNSRKGAVRDRSQTYNPKTDSWVKRDSNTGRFMDGKTSKVNIGKNKTVKMETVTVIKEPNPGYLDHFHFAKKGLALAGAMMNVIMKTKSRLSLLAIGCSKLLLRL